MKKKEQKAIDIMFCALDTIAKGTEDASPPFRALGPSEMRDIAAKALKKVVALKIFKNRLVESKTLAKAGKGILP